MTYNSYQIKIKETSMDQRIEAKGPNSESDSKSEEKANSAALEKEKRIAEQKAKAEEKAKKLEGEKTKVDKQHSNGKEKVDSTSNKTNNNSSSTPSQSPGNRPPTPQVAEKKPELAPYTPTAPIPVAPAPTPKPQTTKAYTGNEVKQKLYNLGFVDKNKGLKLNPYGANGLVEYDYMRFNVLSGDKVYLIICYSNPEVDRKIRTIFNYILPIQVVKPYSILDTPVIKSQTIELDGRKVNIEVGNDGIRLRFSPIMK